MTPIEAENSIARVRELIINNYRIITPIFWLTQQPGGYPVPWKHFKVEGVLTNAYEFLADPPEYKRLLQSQDIYEYLQLKNTPVMLDSGGFMFQNHPQIDMSPESVIELYRKANATLSVILDVPFKPAHDPRFNPSQAINENDKKWEQTVENSKFMYSSAGDLKMLPVLHCYEPKNVKTRIEQIGPLLEKTRDYNDLNIPMLGIGSLVPLLKSSRYAYHGRKRVLDIIFAVRKQLPDAFIHVFGVGGTTTMHMLFYLGVDSIDSKSWRAKAGNGALQLPGIGDRFITPPKGRAYAKLSQSDEELLLRCECPTCTGKTLSERKKILDNKKPETFQPRAIHNAWVYQKELLEARNAIKRENYRSFIEKRMQNNSLRFMYKYLCQNYFQVTSVQFPLISSKDL